ncbi:MAG: SUMF1/EgtB/PvdO family nonheme iron enzyme [Verrucomicrobia bacterium]|nr:SUMF1/EgtB/PvdO family nonheme iron enzyme [Verrucomicrobiota bacterium]
MAKISGQSFAGYEILAKLGEGGFGAVYKARQPNLNRLVALKILAPHLAADAEFVARFKREATLAASFNHANLVLVFAAGESDGSHYIAMEFVEGETLRHRIENHGRLEPREAIAIAVYVAQALQYAWNKSRLIHRDIKPDNIYLSQTGEVKVGDLGLAKNVGQATAGMTATGMMMGSPHYISPEQASAKKDIDFRADIYSLGCTLYHMLTGRPPYEGNDPMVVMGLHVNAAPPAMFKTWPQCPMPLALLVGKMLKKNPRERQQSYEELIAELTAVHEKIAAMQAAAAAPPSGTITFLFTDIEGSSQLWEQHPEAMALALERHNQLLRRAVESHGGFVFKTVGDAFCVAFTSAPNAMAAALAGQRALSAEPWGETGPLRVRMGLHTGVAEARDGDYFGPTLNRVARVLSAGHGGQILLSQAAEQLVRDHLAEGVSLGDLGERSLKNLARSERIFQINLPDLPTQFPTLRAAATPSPARRRRQMMIYGGAGAAAVLLLGGGVMWWTHGVGFVPPPGAVSPTATASIQKPKSEIRNPPAAYPQPRAWIDATADVRSEGLKAGNLVVDGEWMTASKTSYATLGGGRSFRDSAVRVVFSNQAFLYLRRDASNKKCRGFVTDKGARISLLAAAIRQSVTLKDNVGLGAGYVADAEHELVFAAQGDKLSLWLDGKEVATVRDETLTAGTMELSLPVDEKTKPSRIKKVEYGELEAPAYPQPRAWIDATDEVRTAGLKAGSLVAEGDWLKLKSTKELTFSVAGGLSLRNPILRVLFSGHVGLGVRRVQKDGQDSRYSTGIGQGHAAIFLTGPTTSKLTDRKLDSPDRLDGEHEAVFAAQGDTLTLWLDGKVVATAHDSTLSAGSLSVGLYKGRSLGDGRIKKVEYGELDAAHAGADAAFLAEVAALPAEEQVARVVAKLKELNPGFDGKETHYVDKKNGTVTVLRLSPGVAAQVTDISPVAALKDLRQFTCGSRTAETSSSPLSDLTPLRGLRLNYLSIDRTQVSDLSPLRGMPLEKFSCALTKVSDLTPLEGMRLKILTIYSTKVTSLAPLRGMALETLSMAGVPVSDLSVLQGVPLKELRCAFKPERDGAILRSIKTLERINGLSAAEFWRQVEAGKIPGPGGATGSSDEAQPDDGAVSKPAVPVSDANSLANPKAGEARLLDLGGGVALELVGIPPGEFMMGSTKEEQAWAVANRLKEEEAKREGEAPRKTRIKEGFWLGRTEVTVGQWKQFVKETNYVTDGEKKGKSSVYQGPGKLYALMKGKSWRDPNFGFELRDDHPVCCVSWNDAMAFCEWTTERERKAGRLAAGQGVRLPTEAEWEYACRAGTQTKFWWGESKEDGKDRLNLSGKDDGFEFVAPVDSYGARGRNGLGLADMLGNVCEWCLDEYDAKQAHEECYKGNPGARVLRGGSFHYVTAYCRCASRTNLYPAQSHGLYGFRVCVGLAR